MRWSNMDILPDFASRNSAMKVCVRYFNISLGLVSKTSTDL